MKNHPYLRAYMAGVTLPTMFLLVIMTVFSVLRFVLDVSVPIERVVVFPMAVVPNLWGLWNMLFLWAHPRWGHSLAVHGALLALALDPLGRLAAALLVPEVAIPPLVVAAAFVAATIVYYLLWKHAVGFFNRSLGLA